jgi:hypothetical protein
MSRTKKENNIQEQPEEYPLPTNQDYFRSECLQAKAEDENLLSEEMTRRGQFVALRKLALTLMPADWVARMQDEDLCDAMQILYAFYGKEDEGDTIILVERSKLQEYKAARQQYEILLER